MSDELIAQQCSADISEEYIVIMKWKKQIWILSWSYFILLSCSLALSVSGKAGWQLLLCWKCFFFHSHRVIHHIYLPSCALIQGQGMLHWIYIQICTIRPLQSQEGPDINSIEHLLVGSQADYSVSSQQQDCLRSAYFQGTHLKGEKVSA